ncbi:unannotated protein [freshwater metagenome]|uniref:Unannotated protein n=1 Tax=freshwater metagenome TaxID=449393 RepID=A0A6J6NR95_9ZZZZ
MVGLTALVDVDGRARFLELEATPLVRWRVPDGLVATILQAGNELSAMTAPPAQHGPLMRVAPGPDGSGLAWPRPADRVVGWEQGTPRAAPGVQAWFLDDDLVLRVPASEELLVVDGSGPYVWAALTEGVDLETIGQELAEATAVPVERAAAALGDLVAAWIEAGVLAIEGRAALPDLGAPSRAVRESTIAIGEVSRSYRLGAAAIEVRFPGASEADWVGRALAGLTSQETDDPVAMVNVVTECDGYVVQGARIGRRRCASGYQLPSRARSAVVAAWSRAHESPAWQATAITLPSSDAAFVVVGSVVARAALVDAWLDTGGVVVADDLVILDSLENVTPLAIGFAERPAYQWIDGVTPALGGDDAPLVDEEGFLVDYRLLEEAAYRRVATAARGVVILDGVEPPAEVSRGVVLRALLKTRVAGRRGVSTFEAEAVLRWLSASERWQASVEDAPQTCRFLREGLSRSSRGK